MRPSFRIVRLILGLALLPFIDRDKKHQGARRRFVLLRREAEPVIASDVDETELRRAWTELREVVR